MALFPQPHPLGQSLYLYIYMFKPTSPVLDFGLDRVVSSFNLLLGIRSSNLIVNECLLVNELIGQ